LTRLGYPYAGQDHYPSASNVRVYAEPRNIAVNLPVVIPESRRSAEPRSLILLVEDNPVLRDGVQMVLEADGFRVISANHGREALEYMHAECPDLILSDISMPEMDGFALFDAVRARPEWIAIPFIFLSARGGREEVFKGKKLGAEDYLVKPIDSQELVATIRSRLARSQEILLAQVQQAYESSLIMLSNAIELRDQYTRGHVERVMKYSEIIAKHMGMDSGQIKTLQFGSILHDIGKIYIKEEILKKPGSLDDDQWNEMKRHPVIGAELVKNIPYLAPAIPVIRHHHERWDGGGYPDGLAGEHIPLEARIVSVADSLDAMTSSRVYQESCSMKEAWEELLRGSGHQYDPAIVKVIQQNWEEILSAM
jgi:putative two-component system response regulator